MNPRDMDVYGTVKVGERGQIVIPSGARRKLGIEAGDHLLAVSVPSGDGIALIKVDIVKEMIRKMNAGLNMLEEKGRLAPTRRARK